MKRRVAYLTASCMISGHPEIREDHWEHDLQLGALAPACTSRDIELVESVWDAPDLELDGFDAAVIGTTWDYAHRSEEFLRFVDEAAARVRIFNGARVVRWNADKRYLAQLERSGVPVVPTIWSDRADRTSIDAALGELSVDEVVVKPVLGASAWRQVRLRRGDPLPPAELLPPAGAMIQPFLPAAEREGELSLVFFGQRFSHGVQKLPAPGDYRVQSIYGATERVYEPDEETLRRALRVLDAIDEPLLHSRVDMMRSPDGELMLMELELIEPYLYPEQGGDMGRSFASVLAEMLAS